jgi:hypothetical protein
LIILKFTSYTKILDGTRTSTENADIRGSDFYT